MSATQPAPDGHGGHGQTEKKSLTMSPAEIEAMRQHKPTGSKGSANPAAAGMDVGYSSAP